MAVLPLNMRRTVVREKHEKTGWTRYLDAPLIAFVVLMVAAATITAHGTVVFYLYILPPFWAWAAMLVITVGIPLLELAAVLDKANRWRYVLGMLVLLGMEGLAQYFQGQASFVPKVLASFPDPTGVDLATFAQEPRGRLLAVAYLAMPSLIVVYFGYAASARIRDIRGQVAVVERDRSEIEQLSKWLEDAKAEAEAERGDNNMLRMEQARLENDVERYRSGAAELAKAIEGDRKTIELLRTERDALLREIEAAPKNGELDRREIARALKAAEVKQDVIARALKAAPSTVSVWVRQSNETESEK